MARSPRAPRFVFGPVPSRRLGRSLGVDLLAPKSCPFDCVYCQLGCTRRTTIRPRRFVPAAAVLAELPRALAGGAAADTITISGSGEPTLHPDLGAVIAGARRLSGLPVAVITNGALLWRPAVRRALAAADVVLPSLDAGSERVFQLVNRPHPALTLARVVEGLCRLRDEHPGPIALEIFLVPGLNTAPPELERLRKLAARLAPDRIDLNTADRPPAEDWVKPLPRAELERLAAFFGPRAQVVAAGAPGAPGRRKLSANAILALLRRRPETAAGIARGTGADPEKVARLLAALERQGQVRRRGRHFAAKG